MNIFEAREAAMTGKMVVSPQGDVWTKETFKTIRILGAELVFGEWRETREPIVFEADVRHIQMSDCVVIYSESLRHLIGKRVKVTVKVIDDQA